ncbi:hemolysin XhlA family protein [Synechocystis sp. LKSZ1]|uniref:hemolysin XhlA family protein n=1 Tax=Synechocystis sp. LKSZ1 TaxID=3144951 RepID=UPI00336BFB9E
MSTIVETELKDVLAKIDSRLERIETDLTDIKISQARMEEKLDSLDDRVRNLEGNQNKQIWALILAILGALITATIRFSFFPKA